MSERESTQKAITEKDGIQDEWYAEAKGVTEKTLPEFVRKLTEDYGHDYGTIVHACAAAALAAAHAIDHSPAGGISGFQAGAIMWEFIRHWQSLEDHALRLIDYDNLMFPQYKDSFTKISQGTWDHVVKKTKENLEDTKAANLHPDVLAHWQAIAEGTVPFGLQVEGKQEAESSS